MLLFFSDCFFWGTEMKNGEDVVGQHPKKKGAEGALLGTEMIEGWVGVGVIESLNLFKTNQKNIDAGTPT